MCLPLKTVCCGKKNIFEVSYCRTNTYFYGNISLYTCLSSFQVLAVSDIVVYRTRAERLHNDMFHFLSNASGAYLKHFTPELRALSSRCGLDVPLSSLGPAVIVFQETTHTQLLGQGKGDKYTKWHNVC